MHKTMRWIGCGMLAVAAFSAFNLQADVFDEALFWWRGAWDENGDGVMSQPELYNHRYHKNDTVHQVTTLSGNSTVSIVNDDVVSQWCGKTNNMPVLRFEQDGESKSYITVKPSDCDFTADTVTQMVFHVRFKWAGNDAATIFDTKNWWWCRGLSLALYDGHATLIVGRKSYNITALNIKPNQWYDLFLYTGDNKSQEAGCTELSDHNCGMRIDLFYDTGKINTYWPGVSNNSSTWMQPNKYNEGWCCRTTGLYVKDDSVRFGENFQGEIAQIGYWPRDLTYDEMCQVSVSPVMGPALLTVGKADGKSTEFAKDLSVATNSVTLPGSWDGIPAKLDEGFPTVSYRFYEAYTGVNDSKYGSEKINYYTTFPHVLVVKAAAGCGECALDVRIDKGTEKEKKLGKRVFRSGKAEYFWVPALGGNKWHTLDIKRITGTFEMDYVQIYGSWCLGNRVYIYTKDNGCQYKGDTKPYPVEWNIPCQKLTSGLEASTDEFSEAKACTLAMDLTEEFANIGYKYYAATGQSKDAKKTYTIAYVNGVEHSKQVQQWQFDDIIPDPIPAGTFKAGRNTLAIRYDSAEHSSGFWITVRGHLLLPVESSLPEPEVYHAPMMMLLK